MKRLLIFCSSWMFRKPFSPKWEVFCNVQEKDPKYSLSDKFGKGYQRAIHRIKPDFVLSINVGCSERRFDSMEKPKQYGTKYITWSTDSYRHTRRCKTSDLHLTSIPDSTMTSNDNYMPLFFDTSMKPVTLPKRSVEFGIHCRRYDNQNNFRQKHINQIKSVLKSRFFVSQKELHPQEYLKQISRYRYGINIGTYNDGLPNFRSFEYGALGVMPICSSVNRKLLENLFEEHICIYDNVQSIPNVVKAYDPFVVSAFYNERHSLKDRLKKIFKFYFDLEF